MRKLTKQEAFGVGAAVVVAFAAFFLLQFFNDGFGDAVPIGAVGEDPVASAVSEVEELLVQDLVEGEGAEATVGSTLSVHYVGVLSDGTQFDTSVDRGTPFVFELGAGQVIAGWDQGLVGMKEGGRRVLVIPPDLGYGDRGTANIPPNSTIIFEVLLLEVS